MKEFIQDLSLLIAKVRETSPLIHSITNNVTVNDCANIILAIGASPIMADDENEMEDIVRLSSALVLNLGTLNNNTIRAMIKAGKAANKLGIPIVLDPVGAGASTLRNSTVDSLFSQLSIDIVRGNLSEISYTAGLQVATKGVDASPSDYDKDGIAVAQTVSNKYHCVTVITGAQDIISDGKRTVVIHNGNPMMSRVTGTGCMATALTGAFAGISKSMFSAAVVSIAVMGIAGELAYDIAGSKGTASFRTALIDSVSCMDASTFVKKVRILEK